MQQTIYAFLALVAVMTLSLNQQGSIVHVYGNMVDEELELLGAGIATHVIEVVGSKAFDERTTPSSVLASGRPTGASDFTMKASFGTGAACRLDGTLDQPTMTACNDIDDLHMAADDWRPVPFVLDDGRSVPFEVNVEVSYVGASNFDIPLATPSNFKRVVVKVRSKTQASQGRYTNGLVRLERVFAYDEENATARALEYTKIG